MAPKPPSKPGSLQPYGSAKDLPSYQEMMRLLQGGKLLTRFIARSQRKKLLQIEQDINRLVKVVDDFYRLLGSRNWIFHDLLNVSKIEKLLAESADSNAAEGRLIELYRDNEVMKLWITRVRAHEGLRFRYRQIERAKRHYDADEFDSCTLQLIAVMDGFVNDFDPSIRKGLTSRNPDDMTAWNSVVGHHMGLTNALKAFQKTIKKREDQEVLEVYRHGIMHGSITNFDNAVVATKAWSMLFAVADWATATLKAAELRTPDPTWLDTWVALKRHAAYKQYENNFVRSVATSDDPGFENDDVVLLAHQFLDAWHHGRWALVAPFAPPQLLGTKSVGEAARMAKEAFEQYELSAWNVLAVIRGQPSVAEVRATVTVNGTERDIRLRMILWTPDEKVGMPTDDDVTWRLAVWVPHTFFGDAPPGKSD